MKSKAQLLKLVNEISWMMNTRPAKSEVITNSLLGKSYFLLFFFNVLIFMYVYLPMCIICCLFVVSVIPTGAREEGNEASSRNETLISDASSRW